MTTTKPATHHPDAYAVWPCGTYASLSEVWNGDFDWKSDDYEIVACDDDARLIELGLGELIPEEPG